MRHLIFAFALTAIVAAQNPSTPPQQQAAPVGTGIVVGQVVDSATGAPVSAAIVVILRSGQSPGPATTPEAAAGPPRRIITDGKGRFVFHSLVAGSYSLTATRTGYLQGSFGQTQPNGASRRIDLTDGQRLANVSVKLWKTASISGRILEDGGEPAVESPVVLLRVSGTGTARRYSATNQDVTDDRGAYRFSQLPPGGYAVMRLTASTSIPLAVVDAYMDVNGPTNPMRTTLQASGGSIRDSGTRVGDLLVDASNTRVATDPNGKPVSYAPTFYPGVRLPAQATVLTIASGDDRSGVDFGMRLVPSPSVSGRVAGPDGPAANMAVQFVPAGFDDVVRAFMPEGLYSAITRADGTFTALGLPSGNYTATVTRTPQLIRPPSQPDMVINTGGGGYSSSSSATGPGTMSSDPMLWGRASFSVGEANVDNITIQLAYGATLSGRVEFEPGTTSPPAAVQLARFRLTLSPVGASVGVQGIADTSVSPDGTFKTRGYVPDSYIIRPSFTGPGWALKAITIGGRNYLSQPFDLSGADVTGMVVTYTDKISEISGNVAAAADDTIVMLVAVDDLPSIQAGRASTRILSAPVVNGAYRFAAVLSGDYMIFAANRTALETVFLFQDLPKLAAIARQGTRVTIGEKEKRAIALTILPVRQP